MYKTAEAIKLAGGKITREAGPVPGYSTKITSCVDPDGWKTVWLNSLNNRKVVKAGWFKVQPPELFWSRYLKHGYDAYYLAF